LVKPKHGGAFIVIFNINFNILKQFKCALVGQIKDLISILIIFDSFNNSVSSPNSTAWSFLQDSAADRTQKLEAVCTVRDF
jgi:hypothetical protein